MTLTETRSTLPAVDDRPLWPAVRKGWARRCPACGTGSMMSGFLKVADSCPDCGEAFHHHRADDGPAYLTILIVGHLMAPALLITFINRPDPVEAQTCFLIRLASCTGPTCVPVCPSGGLLSTDITNTGFTSALYGTEVMTSICFIE